jgi:RNA polymerase sigma-70 factor (ECF subfamily)
LDDAEQHTANARWAMLLPHRDLALGVVRRATGSMPEAEDCVHDAMLRLVRRSDLDPTRVRSLLVRAALHIAIDRHRAATRQQVAVVRLGGGAAADVVSPEQVAAQRAEAERLLTAIDSLPRRERQVMLLRLAGLNVAETAARLGISTKSVEGAFTRARARVRYLLGAMATGGCDRTRRMGSARGEVAATAVAVLLPAGSGWGSRSPSPRALPAAQGGQRRRGRRPLRAGRSGRLDHPGSRLGVRPRAAGNRDQPAAPRHLADQRPLLTR